MADAGGYARTLNSLSGQTLGAVAAFRYSASQHFVTTMFDGWRDRGRIAWAIAS